jgi:probable HAF family extracellular repeat protein
VKRHTFAALLLVAVACTDSSSPTQQKAASFGIRPAVDTVTVGDSVTVVAERADSTVDAWSVSDSGVASIAARQGGRARVIALATGTVTIEARRQLDSGQATLIILPAPPPPPPPAGSFGIRPALDTAATGDSVTFLAERADSSVDEWRVSDSVLARVIHHQKGQAVVLARGAGTVTVKAKRQADTGQATLVIVRRSIDSISPALDTADIGRSVWFRVYGVRPIVTEWVLSDTSIARVVRRGNAWIEVLARAAGTLTVTARQNSDSVRATLVIPSSRTPAGWEATNLRLEGCEAFLSGFDDGGTVVATVRAPPCDSGVNRAVVYKDGVLRVLPWTADGDAPEPVVVGPSGVVVGRLANNSLQFFVWASPDAIPQLIPGWTEGWIVAVNAAGQVVADSGDSLGALWAQVWQNGAAESLGNLPPHIHRTVARASNNRGQIVGSSAIARFGYHQDWFDANRPFLWEDGVMRNLGVLGTTPCGPPPTLDCSSASASDINENGVVVGTSGIDTLYRAFIWEDGVMRDLGAFPGHYTTAQAINDRGQVLGTVGRWSDTTFFWDNGHAQIVATSPRAPDYVCGWLLCRSPTLGPNGEVLGSTLVAGDNVPHAFIWQAGQFTDLGRGAALTLNSRGEIIGMRGQLATVWRRKS